jgi:hypothetical protein
MAKFEGNTVKPHQLLISRCCREVSVPIGMLGSMFCYGLRQFRRFNYYCLYCDENVRIPPTLIRELAKHFRETLADVQHLYVNGADFADIAIDDWTELLTMLKAKSSLQSMVFF